MVERGGECSTGSLWHSDKNAEKRFNNGDQESTEVLSCVARQIRSCYSDKNKQHQIRKIQKNMNWIQPLLDKGNLKKIKPLVYSCMIMNIFCVRMQKLMSELDFAKTCVFEIINDFHCLVFAVTFGGNCFSNQ